MKKLLGFIICMTLVPALILAGALGFVYNSYFKPVPMEYDFLRGEGEICSVEYAIVSFGNDGSVKTEGIGLVTDLEGFASDLKALDCHKGLPLDSIRNLYGIKTLSGFVINYHDGSFEVITPYFAINSDLKIEKINDILSANVYGFEKSGVQEMLKKYAPQDAIES